MERRTFLVTILPLLGGIVIGFITFFIMKFMGGKFSF